MINVADFKEKLTEELTQITESLKELGIHNPEVQEDWLAIPEDTETQEADENISADRAEEWLQRTATLGALETRYNNITLALRKIENGTYGICEIGGEEIEGDRLDANPAARTCKTHINNEQDLPA